MKTGMAERLKETIVQKKKLVDVICGPDGYRTLPELLNLTHLAGSTAMNVQLSLNETYADISPLRVNTDTKTAFVTIQRGCDNHCAFCIVPYVRGRERSRPISSIVEEISRLSDMGIRDVTLLGQNVNSYRDLSETSHPLSADASQSKMSEGFKTIYKPKMGGRRFSDLLDTVSKLNPNVRIRFTSPHPKDFPDDLLFLMRDRVNICKQIHLPAQSGSTTCLERMRRGYTRAAYLNLVERIREIIPEVALTSDFIAGFCGETESEHLDTISLMETVQYNFCFTFPYSMREKTKAFYHLKDDVPQDVKATRHTEITETFRKCALKKNQEKIGQVHLVLVEGYSKRSSQDFCGRNDGNTTVIFNKTELPHKLDSSTRLETRPEKSLPQVGDYVAVKIVEATSQTLKAVPLYFCSLQDFYSEDFFNK
jgi:MiaB/RimO family radical SAM methylthiotransferase